MKCFLSNLLAAVLAWTLVTATVYWCPLFKKNNPIVNVPCNAGCTDKGCPVGPCPCGCTACKDGCCKTKKVPGCEDTKCCDECGCKDKCGCCEKQKCGEGCKCHNKKCGDKKPCCDGADKKCPTDKK